MFISGPEILLSVCDINVFYGDFHVLHGVSLNVGKGELVAVVGANGHGKSTLLKAVCGLVPITSGEIVYDGENTAGSSAPQLVGRGLVYVAEDRRLFPDMSVKENLLLGAFLKRGRDRQEQTLAHVYELYPRLRERERQLARTLSGGEAQMLALGRGLMSAPDLIAIDEPSLGLAPNLVDNMLQTIRQLKEDGMTVLLVEQSLALIEGVVDRIYMLEEGVISESATASAEPAG